MGSHWERSIPSWDLLARSMVLMVQVLLDPVQEEPY